MPDKTCPECGKPMKVIRLELAGNYWVHQKLDLPTCVYNEKVEVKHAR